MTTGMAMPPFQENQQLNTELRIDGAISDGAVGLRRADSTSNTLPGQPRVNLQDRELGDYLQAELLVPQLDYLAPKLWLVCYSSLGEKPIAQVDRCASSLRLEAHTSPLSIIRPFGDEPSFSQRTLICTWFGITTRFSSSPSQNTCSLMHFGCTSRVNLPNSKRLRSVSCAHTRT